MENYNADYVKWFRNSAPYINTHRGKTFVLMFGGEALVHPNFANIVHDIALLNSLGVRLVLVHGARPQIDERTAEAGIEAVFHRDLRVTDADTLHCVKEAAGTVRLEVEALLSMGLANSPMHGAQIRVTSGNFVTAKPLGVIDGVDFCHTGEVRRIDSEAIRKQLADGGIVLLSPLGYSPTGEVFSLSMEDVATRAAIALGATKLIAFVEPSGLIDAKGELIRYCEINEARAQLEQAENSLARALRAVVNCCENGVPRSHLVSFAEDGALLQELFTRDGAGTLVTQAYYEQLRPADIDDVGGILELIEPLEREGVLVKRSREVLETEIDHFSVIERDGMIVACAALYPYPDQGVGEIACVVTHRDYRNVDRGERLLSSLENQARSAGLKRVFVLTTRTAHWFQERGYVEASLAEMPPDKQRFYNYRRNSKFFVKNL